MAHVPELDGIRGVAVAGVMLMHFVGAIPATNLLERIVTKMVSYGNWGVDLFFVLSGFLITGILVDSKGSSGYLRNFYMRRSLRIFPLYYGVLFLLFVVIPDSALRAFDPQLLEMKHLQGWMWSYLTNFYLGSETSWSIPYISHFWSLAIEEHFYLVWPFVIMLLSRESAMRLCVLLAFVSFGLRIAFESTAPDLLYAQTLTSCRLDALCIGSWFALSGRGENALDMSGARRWLGFAAAGVVALSLWHIFSNSGEVVVLSLKNSAVAVLFGVFIYLMAQNSGFALARAGLKAGWIRNLGKYSYGLYVYHGIVSYAIFRHPPVLFYQMIGSHTVAALLQVTFGIAVSLALAVLSYELYESRFLRLKRFFDHAPAAAPVPQPVHVVSSGVQEHSLAELVSRP